jgi:hypothetical protein
MDNNRDCTAFLGIHIAEKVLSSIFHDVARMPNNHIGYDITCSKDMNIDIKSSCKHIKGEYSPHWLFMIKKNVIADFFLCIAFDNRDDLTPIYLWLIPGEDVNDRMGICISESTIHKWDKYKLDIGKVVACCDAMKTGNV